MASNRIQKVQPTKVSMLAFQRVNLFVKIASFRTAGGQISRQKTTLKRKRTQSTIYKYDQDKPGDRLQTNCVIGGDKRVPR